MTGYDHIFRAIEVFEESLRAESPGAPIQTVSELARRTGYSVHHFTRLFSVIAGTPPKEYILSRTLSEAARVISTSDGPLRGVAERFGFRDYETFSRAFRRRFGMPPSRLREPDRLLPDLTPRIEPARPSRTPRRAVAEPQLVHVDEFHVAGMAFFVEKGLAGFGTQWADFMRVQDRVRGRSQPETFYQVASWPETDALSGLAFLCGLRIEGPVEQEPLFHTRRIPETDCLRFVHPGEIETIGDTYEFIYRDYLSAHDTRVAASWEYQRYPEEGRIEIYIPITARI